MITDTTKKLRLWVVDRQYITEAYDRPKHGEPVGRMGIKPDDAVARWREPSHRADPDALAVERDGIDFVKAGDKPELIRIGS